MNVHVLYELEHKTSKKKYARPSVCLSVRLSGWLYVRTYVRGFWHNNFRRSYRIQTKFGGCLLSMKCRSGIEIQSKIMILIPILNRILIFTKTLQKDMKFGRYL